MKKIRIYHFNNGTNGGTFSVVKNLLKYSQNPQIENHVIYTINKEVATNFSISPLEGAASQNVFYYSPKWNFYYTCKQLAKLLPDVNAIVVAHDWLELGMVSTMGIQNPVVHFVHGNYDYYYDLASKHERSTDQFITVSPVIYNKLCLIIPQRKKDIHYCRFPVPECLIAKKKNKILQIIYCVRSLEDENKQFKILPQINAKLKLKGIIVYWTIVGEGIAIEKIQAWMEQQVGISLLPFLLNEDVINLLPKFDLFILPSLLEGFPVSVVEAMKAGVVPLVTNWQGATEELIISGETGFYFKPGDVDGYSDKIDLLNADRKLLNQLSEKGKERSNKLFDPYVNSKKIEVILVNANICVKKIKKPFKVYGSRLDHPLLSNLAVTMARKFQFYFFRLFLNSHF
ncbi:MAG: glycosyltransferase family 4 protein [Ferruginibacter sp.]